MKTIRPHHQPHVRSIADGDAFAGCTPRQRQRLDSLATVVTVPAGRMLTHQGDRGLEFGVILDGEAVVEVDGREVTRLRAGDHYGEMALLAGAPRGATVTTTAESSVAAMTIPEFRTLLDEMPDVAARIERTAVERAQK